MEGIGNHFALIDARDMPALDWPALAIDMCAHHSGVGADGLLLICRSSGADFRFRMFNPDGTEDICGNGLRCAAIYVYERGLTPKRQLTFEVMDGLRQAEIIPSADGSTRARINMGVPSLRPSDIPAKIDVDRVIDHPVALGGRTYYLTCVAVGTPHAVIFEPLEDFWENMPRVSPKLESHPLFPERINVTWCFVESPESLRIRTWERGVGPTLGCGTGACAALVAARVHGFTGLGADVTSPGGTLRIEWPEERDVYMLGPGRIVFEGCWPIPEAHSA